MVAQQLLKLRLGTPCRQKPAPRSTRSLVSAPARVVMALYKLAVARTLVSLPARLLVAFSQAQTPAAAAAVAAAAVGPPYRKRRQACRQWPADLVLDRAVGVLAEANAHWVLALFATVKTPEPCRQWPADLVLDRVVGMLGEADAHWVLALLAT